MSANQRVARKFVEVITTNLFSTWRRGRMRYSRIFAKRKREKLHLIKDEPAVYKRLGCPTQMTDANQPPSCADLWSFVHKV